jgi:predicted enzyme related to lactoylglutathione lyase
MQLLVNIDVDDLGRALDFYVRAFGLVVGRRFGDAGVELLGASSSIYLLVKDRGSRPTGVPGPTRSYERHWTPIHLDFVVEDIDSALQRALQAGALLEKPIRTSAWGKLALLSDPWGHGFCLVQFVGRGYDEIATNPP